MSTRRLPDGLKREVNRLAHALAQATYTQHRRRLASEAVALLQAGRTHDEVLTQLGGQGGSEPITNEVRAGVRERVQGVGGP